jgi:hypothetical protein
MFAKLYMIFMIPINIGADWYLKADYCIIMCICVYLIGKGNHLYYKQGIRHGTNRKLLYN